MDTDNTVVRNIFIAYLAIVSLIGLVMMVVAGSQLMNMGLKTWVFPAADLPSYLRNCSENMLYEPRIVDDERTDEEIREACEQTRAEEIENYQMQKARDAVQNLAILIVAAPLFALHYRLFVNERRGAKKAKKGRK